LTTRAEPPCHGIVPLGCQVLSFSQRSNDLALTATVTATTVTNHYHDLTSATVHGLVTTQDLVICYA
jgi:hypothetical protein